MYPYVRSKIPETQVHIQLQVYVQDDFKKH